MQGIEDSLILMVICYDLLMLIDLCGDVDGFIFWVGF